MSHQSEIEKEKYRNWVKGGLAYKYLKQGLDEFADDVVKQEQSRILRSISIPGTICNQCIIERLRPKHACITNYAGNYECPWGQRKCNCLHLKKKKCRLEVCDFIMEEILKTHGSTPPTPNWTNTDIQKWCTEPWEVAKCFINAPGYSDKTKAADIDISGLLHVFINSTNLHSHLACSMAGKNIFIKVRERRNKLFHSTTMELEDGEVAECIDDIIEILEDPKELRGRPEAQEAVKKLKQLKESKFVITTNDEIDVRKEAILFVSQKSDELKQMVEGGKNEVRYLIDQETVKAKESIQKCQNDAVKEFNEHREILNERVTNLETNVPDKVEKLKTEVSKRVGKVESDVSVLKSDVSSVKEQVTSLKSKDRELDSKRQLYKRHSDYVKGKQELQAQLVKYYKKHYVKTSLSPLKQQQDTINIEDIYVTPKIEVTEEEKYVNIDKNTTKKPEKRYIQGYHELFQTKGQQHKKIYILGDVGTGKSTFCKMMIENWCNAVSGRNNKSVLMNILRRLKTVSSHINMTNNDVYQMGRFEFLFLIPLQYMSVLKTDVTVDMIKELTKDLTSDKDLIDRIFQEDSMRCLIIIDSLDEWTPPKDIVRKPHVSYGIPNGDRAKDATVITLSRPSAKGILNLKNSEIDLKLQLLGLSSSSLKSFIDRYISNTTSTEKSYNEFISIMKKKQIGHIEKTPLLLQQILWLYCNDMELGKSVSETYCQIFNIMCGWSDHKVDGNDVRNDAIGDKNIFLPENVQIYPRFRNNKRVLFLMGATAFDILTSGSIRNIFGRQHLLDKGLSVDDVTKLIQFGILKESNCFDQTQEDTQFSFIHMSYLEFFAALYVTSNGNIKETKCLREKEDEKQEVLEKLFGTCESASDILQLSNVIKMVCGLSPILIGDLSQRISCIVNKDTHILHLRRHGYKTLYRNDEIVQIQRLMVECLEECGSCDKALISISDLCISELEPIPCLQRINSDDVISLNFEETSDKNIVDFIKQCKHLQHICIKYVSFKNMEEFSFLSQQLSVKQITLHFVDVLDTQSFHEIDFSKQKHLQILELFSCENIRISDLATEQLEFVHIEDCPGILDFGHLQNDSRLAELYIENYDVDLVSGHNCQRIDLSDHNHLKKLKLIKCHDMLVTGFSIDQLEHMYIKDLPHTLDFDLLSKASRLTELHIENCAVDSQSQHARHDIDLSRQNHLTTVMLLDCPDIVITGMNTEKLEQTYIRGCKDTLGDTNMFSYSRKDMELHVNCMTVNTAILKPLLQQTSLRQVTLDNVKCYKNEFLPVDLSAHNQLQNIKLVKSPQIQILNLNTERLEQVHIEHSPDKVIFYLLLNARRLTELTFLCNLFRKQDGDVVHTLHNLDKLHVKFNYIDTNALTVTPDMRRLKTIKLEYVDMCIDTWRTFLDSLLTLHQSVEVNIKIKTDNTNDAFVSWAFPEIRQLYFYVALNPKFKVISGHDDYELCFQTKIADSFCLMH
ncbi:uncharacterized protein LOC132734022 [Ruditapes philippinarum]|uniref:uncharacterized protein LOC132734022 n=1 Tax=Ruditapes philippinarum TaxID=129788 RepID=UPI00295C33C4|nr:uncharacterized protein LOC132734022 [Ruditapes philippinarum]